MRDVDHLLARKAGEQILVATGEPDDFVGEHRTHNQRHVTREDESVDAYLDGAMDPPA